MKNLEYTQSSAAAAATTTTTTTTNNNKLLIAVKMHKNIYIDVIFQKISEGKAPSCLSRAYHALVPAV